MKSLAAQALMGRSWQECVKQDKPTRKNAQPEANIFSWLLNPSFPMLDGSRGPNLE